MRRGCDGEAEAESEEKWEKEEMEKEEIGREGGARREKSGG